MSKSLICRKKLFLRGVGPEPMMRSKNWLNYFYATTSFSACSNHPTRPRKCIEYPINSIIMQYLFALLLITLIETNLIARWIVWSIWWYWFLTWNGPVGTLQMFFGELNRQHPDVQLVVSIDSSVHFLDAHIENRKSSLYACVHHDPTEQRFLLLYAVGCPRLLHR